MLEAISPVDGRYHSTTNELSRYFSEYGLIKYRVFVEIEYLLALADLNLGSLDNLSKDQKNKIQAISRNFSLEDAKAIKKIEKNPEKNKTCCRHQTVCRCHQNGEHS